MLIRKIILLFCLLLFLVGDGMQSVFYAQETPKERKYPPCKNCFSVNFNDVDIQDWLKTMASLIRKNILMDESVKGKITIISHRKVPIKRALSFMKRILEVKGYGIVEEPDLLRIVNLKSAQDAVLPKEKEVDAYTSGVISRVITLPSKVDATEMVNVFKSVAGKNVTIVPYIPTNTIIITGFARNVLRALTIGNELVKQINTSSDTSTSGSSVHIYNAHHITAESLAGVLSKLDSPRAKKTKGGKRVSSNSNQKIRAVAHKESNSLVVTASSGEWFGIKNIIKDLDVPRTQILLEVLIAEISSDNTNDFGIDWRSFGEAHTQFNTGLSAESNIINPTVPPNDPNFLVPERNTLNGFSLGFIGGNGDLLALLKANLTRQNFNVLSSPQLLALNNQEAEINVGQDVPVKTRVQQSANDNSLPIENYEYKPAGITLKVTPQINTSGQITLNFFAEISNIQGQEAASSAGGNPTFTKRNVKTHATVLDKQTIVLGGLISSENSKTVNKVPFLGDIPLLGYFFRRTVHTVTKTNLMIFMTPHVLQDKSKADHITNLKRKEQREGFKKLHNDIIVWPEKRLENQ